mgnify:CR=1 FL=1
MHAISLSLDRSMQLTATREDTKNKPVLGLNVILVGFSDYYFYLDTSDRLSSVPLRY